VIEMGAIPLVDLGAQYRPLTAEIQAAIQRVLESGQFILGREGEALEREIAAYCGTAHAVAVASGTDAIELALRACGIGPGDEVITPAVSFFATAQAVLSVGARPVFVDIDAQHYTMDPDAADAAVSARTKAILPVHLYGQPCAMDALMRLASRRKLLIIEDCAQAIGARVGQRRVGSFGAAGCFSFYPTKNLGAYGDGGMVVTNDARVAEEIRLLRTHGSRDKRQHLRVSGNSRLDELQAAILRAKLPHLDAWNRARREHADTYRRLIEQAGLEELILPREAPGTTHVFHLYVVRSRQRDRLHERLVEAGIQAQVHYALTLPQQPALSFLGYRPGQCSISEQLVAEAVSLPLYPELTLEQIEEVVGHVAHKSFDRVR
jgi:dTDP-4-amino-4,6-dideoxygalactose transaminase